MQVNQPKEGGAELNPASRSKPENRERPILFNGAMVRAILEGRKTVTRRAVKSMALDWLAEDMFTAEYVAEHSGLCPFGEPGDRLWVRETFALLGNEDGVCIDWSDNMVRGDERNAARIYQASCPVGDYGLWQIPDKAFWKPDTDGMQYDGTWRPSIHMPRWASRILLEITTVRVERLQDITKGQAEAEGVRACEHDLDPDGNGYSATELFSILWSSLYGIDSYNANPWVWVVEFKRVEVANA
ncbi:morphogenetic protein [Stutzerimonas nitrititolerans]|uniref:morphogenetic protein n=1 Tax=Stutzerimonas nitrititolerans TaxID=2482751 RepID=UPI0028AD2D65|nr:morphogenetic protein [Stutzerimonas nitrititolerans]